MNPPNHGLESEVSSAGNLQPIEVFFDGRADKYDKMVSEADYAMPNWISSRAGQIKGSSVLDLACGTGNLGMTLREQRPDFTFVGVDVSQGMVAKTKERGFYEAAYQFDLADGLPESIAGNSYDLIVALGFLEFLTHPVSLLSEMRNVLQPGGRIWCSLEKTEVESRESGVIRPELGFAMHHYSESEAEKVIRDSGLRLIEIMEVGAYVRTYDQALVPWWLMECEVEESHG